MITVHTDSAEATIALGKSLGEKLGPGDVIALTGDLGAGKTTMTKGIALGAGIEAEVSSPTFTLIHEHPGRVPFYHVDLYRLTGDEDAKWLGIEDYIYSDGITIIEWADVAPSVLPPNRIEIHLGYDESSEGREIRMDATSERLKKIVEMVVSDASNCD